MKVSLPSGTFKMILGWVAVFLFRLIPFRPPNVEPMLAAVMPFSKRFGLLGSFLFGFLGIVLYDAITSGWGIWTLVTAVCYGALGLGSYFYFKNREASVGNFLRFGIVGTIAYDLVTGLTIGPIVNHQPLMSAVIGQIPFTLMHLAGTILFATTVSPALYRWVVENETLEISALWTSARVFVGIR